MKICLEFEDENRDKYFSDEKKTERNQKLLIFAVFEMEEVERE